LTLFEPIPPHVAWCFTTTVERQDKLFDDLDDACPLLSRCIRLDLSRRDLATAVARACVRSGGVRGRIGGSEANFAMTWSISLLMLVCFTMD
jgi:hypothetical protein